MSQQQQQMAMFIEQLSKMSVDERTNALEAVPEPMRDQMKMLIQTQEDLQHIEAELKPATDAPDKKVEDFTVVKAIATMPSMVKIDALTPGEKKFGDCLDDLEAALHEVGALDEAALKVCGSMSRPHRRNALLLLWQMYQKKLAGKVTLDEELSAPQRSIVNQVAQKTLAMCQMQVMQKRWVQVALAIMRMCAFVVNGLWSHTDADSIGHMATILESDGLPPPKLKLEAATTSKETGESETLVGKPVVLDVRLIREHAGLGELTNTDLLDPQKNPQQILEAYYCLIEGVKPDPTPNSLLGCTPMVVKKLDEKELKLQVPFGGPPTAGTYQLRVHCVSTSVVGADICVDVTLTMVDDDVPALE